MVLNETKSRATYEVKFTLKKVRGSSQKLKGEIKEKGGKQFFELAIPIRSFLSGDKELDQHMQKVTLSEAFPDARALGEVPMEAFTKDMVSFPAQIEFHGVRKTYLIQLKNKGTRASFMLDLEAHGIDRPSMLGIKIKNDVLMTFDLCWDE